MSVMIQSFSTKICSLTSVMFIAIFFYGYSLNYAYSQDNLEKLKVVSDYKKALVKIEQKFAALKVTAKMVQESGLDTPNPHRVESITKLDRNSDELMKYTQLFSPEESKKKGVQESVICGNGDVVFNLQRKLNTNEYLVLNISKDRKTNHKTGQGLAMGFRFINYLFTYTGVPIKELIIDPGFVLNRVDKVLFDGKDMLKLQFEIMPASKIKVIKSGSITVCPAEGWLLHQYESNLGGPLQGTTNLLTIQYVTQKDGSLIPQRLVDMRGKSSKLTVEFDSIKFEVTPLREFTLDYYGLPELDVSRSSSGTNWTAALFLMITLLSSIAAITIKY